MRRKPVAFGEPWLHSLRNAKASLTFHSFAHERQEGACEVMKHVS